ncbi:hypothetical protein BGW38_007470 [Lunasporangiospora selenospora]|uniref:Glyoxalase/fosfomycin resistance/dioxygenase domain-containing protein n=1 Tax=Lunasporangiospora selenospora TaxID=979761 RepID=A0A9P6FYB9_9FUNG|nr:hypothetical protein BGW38_007470 [Lunasporangiospora selenospora]
MRIHGTIGHLSLSVSDFEKGKLFYGLVLGDFLGYTMHVESPEWVFWTLKVITITPGNQTPHHKSNPGLHHLAFNVESRERVDEYYNRILAFYTEHGGQGDGKTDSMGRILDAPASYPEYTPSYYA